MRILLGGAFLMVLVGLVSPIASASERVFEDEPVAVQEALAPFKSLIQRLPVNLREPLYLRAQVWVGLTSEERATLRENLVAWEDRAPLERLALRERFEAWEHLDERTRAAALDAAQRFASLPEDIRQGWRSRFDALDPAQRQRYLFDPTNRLAMDLANDLFRFVPASEQADTLAMLRDLTPAHVAALRKALARLPPSRRDTYRQKLLSLDPAARAAELEAKP